MTDNPICGIRICFAADDHTVNAAIARLCAGLTSFVSTTVGVS